MKISFRVRGVDKVKEYLASVPRGATRTALQAIAEWLIGDSQSGLAHPEPYKYVSRKSAYGFAFFTDKQRRYFFYALNAGIIKIGNNRTGESEGAWTYKPTEATKGYNFRLTNETPGAFWTRDDKSQARQLGKVGWWTVSKVVAKNIPKALKAATLAVNNYLKSKGKK